tara:strand:+ start:179 stop:1078 length:900 start_codon:yes stop_codon:yes gene_type:complete
MVASKKKDLLSKKEFYRILDEAVPGGNQAKARRVIPLRKIFLERISMDGLEEMHEYSTDERLYKHLSSQPSKTLKDTEQYLRNFLDQIGNKVMGRTRMIWFIKTIDSSKIIGTTSLLSIDYDNKSVEWGYGIDPKFWGRGYILEIQQILKKYVFETLCINKLWGGTRIDNQRTKSSLKLTGAMEEGILRQAIRDKNGDYYDVWRYSILAEDYFSNGTKTYRKNYDVLITKKKIAEIISKTLNEPNTIVLDNIESVKSWDSLSHISVILDIEKYSGYSFTSKEIAQATSIENIYNILNSK